MFQLVVLIIACALILGGLVFCKKKNAHINFKILNVVLSWVLITIVLIKNFAADGFTTVINGGTLYDYTSNKTDIIESIIRCGLLSTQCLIFSLLVNENKYVKWILSYISLPFVVLSFAYFYWSVDYFVSPSTFGLHFISPILASAVLVAEYLLTFSILVSIHLFEKVTLDNKKEKLSAVKLGVFSQLICIPFLVFPAIFGVTNLEMSVLTPAHICWIISIPIIYCIIYFSFRNDEKQNKTALISVMSFFIMIHMTASFKVGYQSNRFPLQLCNLAPYLFVVLLITKKNSLFNWVYVANPVGALIAIFTLADRDPIFNFWMIHYIVEHLYVFIIPILFVVFGIFKKPNFKTLLKDALIWFSVYFFICLFVNCIHNGLIVPATNSPYINDVNFFYLLDCPVKDVLPFYSALEFGEINLFGQNIFIGYVGFIYVVFFVLSIILYYVQEGIFKLTSLNKNKSKNSLCISK